MNSGTQNPNPNITTLPQPMTPEDDLVLPHASHLTRMEILKRRSKNLKQLSRCYRDHYWALTEDLKARHREFYWRFGTSPFKEDQIQRSNGGLERENGERESGVSNVEGTGDDVNKSRMDLDLNTSNRCSNVGCKFKAMPLTSFCHLHILSDPNQKLYKACTYVIKNAQAGNIMCGKPILKTNIPSLCNVHFVKGQKHVIQALKQAGCANATSSKFAPKFHVVWVEYVRFIQARRRALRAEEGKKIKLEC